MSGGIDSTIVAYLLKKEGHYIEGVYMKLHNLEDEHKTNLQNIEKVASFLDIKYRVVDLKKRFEKEVFNPFIEEYKNGNTPNPCVFCNRSIKLGELVEYALSEGFDKLATGHYVKTKDGLVCEAKDKRKDQSYFLAMVSQKNLKNTLFPLGDWLKDEVRQEARGIEILETINQNKESREICFVENSYIDILKEYMEVDKPGIVVDKSGNKIGSHKGYMHYTIGKRRGFRVDVAHKPNYVLKIDAKNNEITVGPKEALAKDVILLDNFSSIYDKDEFEAKIKIRYRSPKVKCKVTVKEEMATITLFEPLYGVASGQIGVLYDNECIIASGVIKRR